MSFPGLEDVFVSVPGPSRPLRDLRFMSAVEVLSGLDMLTQRFSECDRYCRKKVSAIEM
jgi:hypothetical protein